MSDTLKNLVVGILFIGVVAAGYFMFTQRDSASLTLDGMSPRSEDLLLRTQVFIERRQQLEVQTTDVTFFQDPRFTSLRSYTAIVPDQTVGRTNIFDAPSSVPTTRTAPIE
jgi:hypothetical protein